MRQKGRVNDIWTSFPSHPGWKQMGNPLGPLLENFTGTEQRSLWPRPAGSGGQLGRDTVLATARNNLVALRARNVPLATRQRLSVRQSVENFPAPQRLDGHQNPNSLRHGLRPNNSAIQRDGRSIFDIAGRFRDFQAGPKIARPNLAEELIPVIGPAWDAAADLQAGHYGSAAFNGAMAIGDFLPVGYGVKAVRAASKISRELGTIFPKAYGVQRKMHSLGLASAIEDVHHVFRLNGIGRNVANWRNNPLFLKVLPREVHQRLHGRVGEKAAYGLLPRLWHGTTDWMKAGAAGVGSYGADAAENFEAMFWPEQKPIPRVPGRPPANISRSVHSPFL